MDKKELKRVFDESIINVILFWAYSFVLANESNLGIDEILGGESIAHVAITILFTLLIFLYTYIRDRMFKYYRLIRNIFDVCVSVTFESGDTVDDNSTENDLKVKLNRYSTVNRTYDFHINVVPTTNLLLIKKAFSIIGNAKKLENLYLQLYWSPTTALQIKPHKDYHPVMTTFQGYPCICFYDIVPSNTDKYGMKISSTTDQKQSKIIGFELRKCCDKKAGIMCRLLFYFINVNMKNAKGNVEILDE